MRKIIFILILIIVITGGWYVYSEYNRENADLTKVEAKININAVDLVKAFDSDVVTANKKYLGKILAVTGTVTSIENNFTNATIVLGDSLSLSAVRCSMDTTYIDAVSSIKVGQFITVKGHCTGFNESEIEELGSDVILNECVIKTMKN